MPKQIREVYGSVLAELGETNENIVVLDADLSGSTKSAIFGKAHPERFFNMGIAEQNMVATAAGMAACGKIPFVNTFTVFLTSLGLLSARDQICYANLNVKFGGAYCGMSDALDGASHHATEDIAFMRALPNMKVIAPADAAAARWATKYAVENYGPMYLRFTRDAVPVIYDEDQEFTIGKAVRLRDGKDVAIIAIGDTVRLALDAARELESKGISARVLDMHTLKPLDNEAVDACINDIGKIITVEDHNIINGLGSAVCERTAEAGKGKVVRIGIQDCFGQSAPYERLLAVNGITVENIVEKAMKGF